MKYIFLSSDFWKKYPSSLFPEIEYKPERPYIFLCVTIDQKPFAIPLRSHINHKYALITDQNNNCGADFTKAVYISDLSFIDTSKPIIRNNEHNFLKGKEKILERKFMNYIRGYVKAMKSDDPNKNRPYIFSTLPYFENEVNYEALTDNYFTNNSKSKLKI